MDLQSQLNLTYMFVTHNLSVVKHISNNISVMYLGQLVETSPSRELFKVPLHPYTKALVSVVPVPNPKAKRKRVLLKGEIPSAIDIPSGCRFHVRCPMARQTCSEKEPNLLEACPDHYVACQCLQS
jgi:oligopeptide/dipeptide ABC transporter ATP-binding protein